MYVAEEMQTVQRARVRKEGEIEGKITFSNTFLVTDLCRNVNFTLNERTF